MRVTPAVFLLLLPVVLLALGGGRALEAQWAVDLRGGVVTPVGEFGSVEGFDAEPGAGFGLGLTYDEDTAASVYAGGSATWFGCTGCADGEGYRSTGFDMGLKLLINRWVGPLPWMRGGVVLHRLRIERGATRATSDWSLGYQVAAGVDVPLVGALYVTPSLRYKAYEAGFDGSLADRSVRYLGLELAAHLHLDGMRW